MSQNSQAPSQDKPSDKELNFRQLEAKHQRQLDQERSARIAAEQRIQELSQKPAAPLDDDQDDEPYVDHKKLERKLQRFGQQQSQQTQSDIQKAVQQALSQERQQNWIKSNPDFYDVLEHSNKLAMKDPDLAESILDMPEGFERQKLVYKTIKSQGLHKPEPKATSIQDKVDANRRSPYYQPSNVGSAPYSSQSDFSDSGKKQAYDKMQELKKSLRI